MSNSTKRRTLRQPVQPALWPVPSDPTAPPGVPREPGRSPDAPPKPGGHELYRAVMRSHDRVATRHLNPEKAR